LLRSGTETLRASGSETARLDAELLLGHVLRSGRAGLIAAPEAPVGADHAAAFGELIKRRAKGEPVAYIRGLKEFYGLVFTVDSRALIPRPETELLVDLALQRLGRMLTEAARPADASPLLVWDVGTGSGAICVALAVECRKRGYAPDVRFRATDSSEGALRLATENAVGHGVADSIAFAVADLVDLPSDGEEATRADLLVANLPYVPTAVIPTLPVAASYEPVAALDGGADGMDVIRRLAGSLETALAPRGEALFEIGVGQEGELRNIVEDSLPGWQVTFHDDLAGIPRVAELMRADLS
jgi:release factor glutamine methyltransferase